MVQSDKNSNSDGRAITVKRMGVTLLDTIGIILKLLYRSGRLSINIRNQSGSCGYSPETLFLTLQLSKDGNIFGKWVLS